MTTNNVETRLKSLEDWREKLELQLYGDMEVKGALPLLKHLSETLIGPSGETGMRKQLEENTRALDRIATERKTLSFVIGLFGGLLGTIIPIVFTAIFKGK